MKSFKILTGMTALLLFIACIEESTPVTGSQNVDVYTKTSFEVTERTASSNALTARGTIKNNSNETFYAPWYIEGDFYTDQTYSFKLGGDNFKMNYSLAPGESTGWELVFSSSLYNESEYSDFGVKNLRAFKD